MPSLSAPPLEVVVEVVAATVPVEAIPQGSFVGTTVQMAQIDEYDSALLENIKMRNNVEILHQGENALQQTIRNGEATIDEVKKEEQTELMVERQQLREDLRSLKMAINKIVVRNAISSFSVAIVDLLQLDQVVETLKTDVVRGAKRLCASRTSVGQYLTQGDDPMVIAYKKLILREKLHSVNTAVKKWLDGAYPGLVDEVKRHLDADPLGSVVANDQTEELVAFWWM